MSESQSLYVVLTANSTQYKRIIDQASRDMRRFGDDVDDVGNRLDRNGLAIDRFSGRLQLALEAMAAVAPALVPIGGVAVAGVAGLAGLFGAATIGAVGLLAATQGVGDALKAVEKARLDPTVANLEAAEKLMARIAPEAQAWVRQFQELRPIFADIRDAGAAELFPGLSRALDSAEQLAPVMERLVAASAGATGDAAAEAAASLATQRWAPFLEFLEDEVPEAIKDVTTLVGSLGHAGAELWMSLDPGNDRFVDWLLDVAAGFDRWASSPQGREDVEAFLDYVQENGPAVEDFFVAVVDLFAEVVTAAAPLGGPVLQTLTVFAKALAAIADSDLGTPILAAVTAYSALNRVLAVTVALQAKVGAPAAGGGRLAAFGGMPVVAGVAALALVATDIAAANNALMSSISSGDLTQATTDLKAFKKEVEIDPRKKDFGEAFVGAVPGGQLFTDGAGIKNEIEGWFGKSDVEEAEEAIRNSSRKVDMGFGVTSGIARARADQAEATRRAEAADLGLSSASAELAAAMGLTNAQMVESIALLDEKTAASMGAFGAETRYRDALNSANEQAATNNAGIKGNSDAALGNRVALEQLAGAWGAQRDALVANGASVDVIEGKYRKARSNFVKTAVAMGVPIEQARVLARSLNAIPSEVVTEFRTITGSASAEIQGIIDQLASVPKSVRTDFYVNQVNAINKRGNVPEANGGIYDGGFRAFADGGFGSDGWHDRESQIVAGGANILWGEPETGWEAYISGKPSQRGRNKAIWAETGRRLGYEPTASFGSEHLGGARVHHTFEHRVVVTGELDTGKAVTQLRQDMRRVAKDTARSAQESADTRGRMSWL